MDKKKIEVRKLQSKFEEDIINIFIKNLKKNTESAYLEFKRKNSIGIKFQEEIDKFEGKKDIDKIRFTCFSLFEAFINNSNANAENRDKNE